MPTSHLTPSLPPKPSPPHQGRKTPNSSFRRSVGAILKKKLKLEVLPRELKNPKYDKYRFTKDGESQLTDWIKKNCVIGYWASIRNLSKKELMDLETALTVHYEPTLNLAPKTIKHNKQARHLTSLRKVCSDEWRKKLK